MRQRAVGGTQTSDATAGHRNGFKVGARSSLWYEIRAIDVATRAINKAAEYQVSNRSRQPCKIIGLERMWRMKMGGNQSQATDGEVGRSLRLWGPLEGWEGARDRTPPLPKTGNRRPRGRHQTDATAPTVRDGFFRPCSVF